MSFWDDDKKGSEPVNRCRTCRTPIKPHRCVCQSCYEENIEQEAEWFREEFYDTLGR